jgi:23S rRNA (pseudouridine1915-N3)-methyltransferase
VCVGRLRPPHDQAGIEYERRVAHMTSFRADEVAPEPLQRGEDHARRHEAARMRTRIVRNAWTVCLAPAGRQAASSDDFAAWLERRLAAGRPVAFVIGGASGIDAQLLAGCDEQFSLGSLTMPHQLARVVLVEQIYRALCVLQGHPYPH